MKTKTKKKTHTQSQQSYQKKNGEKFTMRHRSTWANALIAHWNEAQLCFLNYTFKISWRKKSHVQWASERASEFEWETHQIDNFPFMCTYRIVLEWKKSANEKSKHSDDDEHDDENLSQPLDGDEE